MSILSEILSSGHVDRELLDALDDEQKQLLFCQMRAEQVRKWQASEEALERDGMPPRKPKKKSLRWLLGQDNDVWVWVMGEHPKDQSIDEILDEEVRQKAHDLALRELASKGVAGTVNGVNGHNSSSMSAPSSSFNSNSEEALMAQLGSLKVGAGTESFYDDATELNHMLLFQPNKVQTPGYPPAHESTSQEDHGYPYPPPNGTVTAAKVSSFNMPAPQRAEVLRGDRPRPPLLPKPQSLTKPNDQQELLINGVRMRQNRIPQKEEEVVKKRESEIYQTLQEQRERFQREAEAEEARRRAEWEEQQRKAREAETAMREMAQKAREQHRQLIRTSTSILPALKDTNATSLREAIKNLPRPPKPKSRAVIVDWFKNQELPRGTGLDPKTKAPAPWFHGIISREQAEILLQGKPTGSFLVRVSERIWGYTVSYVVGDGSFKHFLVEKIPQGYQFLGTNQVVHDQLFDLVSYHETAPITAKGGEILKWAVGQVFRPADYTDLITDNFYNVGRSRQVARF